MWEKIPDTTASTERLWVHGGWLVRTILVAGVHTSTYSNSSGMPVVSMVFIPDPFHVWVLTPEPKDELKS